MAKSPTSCGISWAATAIAVLTPSGIDVMVAATRTSPSTNSWTASPAEDAQSEGNRERRHVRDDISRRHVPLTRAYFESPIPDFNLDGVPTAVLLPGARISEVVLLAQFVGDARGRAVEVAELADDLRAAAAIVSDGPERIGVYPIAAVAIPEDRKS